MRGTRVALQLMLWFGLLLTVSAVTTLNPWDELTPTERCLRAGLSQSVDFRFEAGSSVEGRFALVPFGLVCDYTNGDGSRTVTIAAAPLATPFIGFASLVVLGSATYLVASAVRHRRSLKGQ